MEHQYTYTNSYEPFSDDGLLERPKGCDPMWSNLATCKDRHPNRQFTKDQRYSQCIIMRCFKGELLGEPHNKRKIDFTSVPKCGPEEFYLHVYGRRPYVELILRDQQCAHRYFDGAVAFNQLYVSFSCSGVQSIVDAKLVYKRPYIHAAAGFRYMVKLYLGGDRPISNWQLRQALKSDRFLMNNFHPYLLNSSIDNHSKWYVANRAPIHGQISVVGGCELVNSWTKQSRNKMGAIYYKDVRFHNHEQFNVEHSVSQIVREKLLGACHRILKEANNNILTQIVSQIKILDPCSANGIMGWREFKSCYLHRMIPTANFSEVLQQMRRCRDGCSISKEMYQEYMVKRCMFMHLMRTEVKQLWECEIRARYRTESVKKMQMKRLVRNTNALRWAFFDIEVTYVPHQRNEDLTEINLISVVLFDHAHDVPYEIVLFMLVDPNRRDRAEAKRLNETNILRLACDKLPILDEEEVRRDLPLTMRYYEQEKNLLLGFLAYIRDANVHTVGYFNGHKFDLPFIIARLRYLKVSACVSAKQTGVSLTHREDNGLITQRRKGASKTYKSDAIRSYKTQVKENFVSRMEAEEGGGNGSRWDDQGDYDYDDGDDAYDENATGGHDDMPPTFSGGGDGGFGERGKVGRYMMEARKNMTITMHNVGLLDVMYEVGDKNRGCKLDTAALEWLGVQKIKDERVSYENITKTWRDGDVGDLEALAAYCIRDTLLTVLLAKKKQVGAFYMADSTLSYMNMRELYTGEMVKSTICTQANYGHPYSVSSPDTTFLRYEAKLWQPDYDFDIDRDMCNLAPLAGRTVQNSGYYDIPIGTVDYSGQYPSIQRAHNICSSTWVTEKQSKYLPQDAFITKTLYNVRPKVKHSCAVNLCKGGRGETDKCTFSAAYEAVEYKIRYVKRDFFHGLIPQSLEDLANLRKDYKMKMKDSADGIETQLYDTLQKAVKCRMNAAYGVTLRITPLVGTTITQFGREQTEMAARLGVDAGMVVVNGDTDSVMLMHKPACLPVEGSERTGWLSRMSRNLLATPQAPVTLIFKALIDQFEEFCKRCNRQLPPPCSLEFEKLFTYQRMDEKKCYLGQKVLPDLSMRSHIAGMTGMKADRTRVKSAAQFIPGKLTSARDFEGLAAFATDLYDVVSTRLRAHEIGRVKVEQLANDIDIELETFVKENDIVSRPTNEELRVPHLRKVLSVESILRVANISQRAKKALSEFDRKDEQSRIERVNNPMGDIIPLPWVTSSEKVGDLTDPKTRATKEAILSCKRRGDSIHGCGQLFIDVLRNHEVQVSAPLSKSIAVLLRAPEGEDIRKRRRARMLESLAQTDCKRMITLEDRRKEEERKKKNVINKLTITAMPKALVAVPEDRVQISERERALLFNAQTHISVHDKLVKKERADKYANLLIHPKMIAPERGERLRSYIEHYTPNDIFVPLWWYDEDYCEICLPAHMGEWWSMPHGLSAASLWSMYVNRRDRWSGKERYMLVRGGDRIKIMITAEIASDVEMLDCDHSSWNRNHVHELKDDTIIGLDMRDRYAQQTRSTPYVISSVDGGQRFLTNKDSYCLNRANRFSFQLHHSDLNRALRSFGPNVCLAFKMCVRTNDVILTSKLYKRRLCNVKILRDDGRDSSRHGWLWNDVYYVDNSSITRRMLSLTMMGCQRGVDEVKVSFICGEESKVTGVFGRVVDPTEFTIHASRSAFDVPREEVISGGPKEPSPPSIREMSMEAQRKIGAKRRKTMLEKNKGGKNQQLISNLFTKL